MFIRQALTSGSNELRYILLFIISIVLVTWQYFGMETRLNAVPSLSSSFPPVVHDDHINGGVSVTELEISEGRVDLDCQIVLSDTFAFCGVSIPIVSADSEGIDLGKYDSMEIILDYESTADDTLLIYMINDELTATGNKVAKSTLRAVSPSNGVNRFVLPTRQFSVPSWWLFQNSQSGADPAPHIDNVSSLQITTGDNTVVRNTRFSIRQIVFHGKWISAEDLYLTLLAGWLILFSLHAINNIQSLSERIKESRKQNRELMELNRFLSIQKDQYESMAKHDRLTGALNRAGVRDVLENVLHDHQYNQIPCSLLAMDLDHFKDINDELGHDAGDTVLKNFTRFINEHTRDRDTFARWGGEEFMLICPHTSLRAANNLAETLRGKVETAELVPGKTVTCSFGVATLNDHSIKQWFKRADEALYEAKSAGRNCVRSAD